MDPLPSPPVLVDAPLDSQRPPRAGELTTGWRIVFGIAWAGVILAFAAVWKSARTLGLGPWWLGPAARPRSIVVELLPFLPALAMVFGALRNLRWLPVLGIAAGAATAAVAFADLDGYTRMALVEMATGTAGLLVSVAAFAGLYRSAAPASNK